MKNFFSPLSYLGAIVLLNIVLAIYATPVYDWGDNLDYLDLARSLLGQPIANNVAHRSPLYAVLLAGFMEYMPEAWFYKAVIVFQYLLVAGSSWMIYRLGVQLMNRKSWALFAALLFNLSFATLFYANNFLSETLAVFLLVWAVWVLCKLEHASSYIRYIGLGILVGLLALTRFNLIPLVVTFGLLIGINLWRQKAGVKRWIGSQLLFLLPYLLLIHAWSFYNWQHNGFYGLFPDKGLSVSRNVVVACIQPKDQVSEANKAILDIFLAARSSYLANPPISDKGSFGAWGKSLGLESLYSGYPIYLQAVPALRTYFGLSETAGEYELSQKLTGFYQEILAQHRLTVLQLRFLSFCNGLRAAESGALPARYGNINLNFLPAIFFKLYKVAVFFINVFVLLAFFYFLHRGIKKDGRFDFRVLCLLITVLSVWGINFAFATAGDANRYKYPADPLIILLFVYYLREIYCHWRMPKKTIYKT